VPAQSSVRKTNNHLLAAVIALIVVIMIPSRQTRDVHNLFGSVRGGRKNTNAAMLSFISFGLYRQLARAKVYMPDRQYRSEVLHIALSS
jgi:hypothetical protein